MGLLDKLTGKTSGSAQTTASNTTPVASNPKGGDFLDLSKGDDNGGFLDLAKDDTDGVFTLICTWGAKDYDLYALVEYVDGRVEVVSCFGTTRRPNDYSQQTRDGAVRHVSGDQTAYGSATPQEVIKIRLADDIRAVVPVVYSAKNSGTGSFRRYGVSTYVIPGDHDVVPSSVPNMVRVSAVDASSDDNVYSFVPAIIHNSPSGARLEAAEKYSRRNSELRPTVRNGQVTMDSGEENSDKK